MGTTENKVIILMELAIKAGEGGRQRDLHEAAIRMLAEDLIESSYMAGNRREDAVQQIQQAIAESA